MEINVENTDGIFYNASSMHAPHPDQLTEAV